MNKIKLEIEIIEINVEEDFFEIHYKYSFNGKKWESDMLDSDYDNGLSIKLWKKELEKGEAMNLVFQKIAEDNTLFN